MPTPKPLVPSLALVTESFLIYKDNFSLFGGLVAWLILPYALLRLITLIPNAAIADSLAALVFVALFVFSAWLTTVLFLLSRAVITGSAFDLSKVESDAWRLVPSLLLVALLEGLVVVGGLILFIVPGLVFAVWYGFAQLAVVFDGKRGLGALTFSQRLVAGRFFAVLWRLIAGPGLILAIHLFIVIAAVTVVGVIGRFPEEFFASDTFVMWTDLFASVVELFFLPWFILYATLLYQNLTGRIRLTD